LLEQFVCAQLFERFIRLNLLSDENKNSLFERKIRIWLRKAAFQPNADAKAKMSYPISCVSSSDPLNRGKHKPISNILPAQSMSTRVSIMHKKSVFPKRDLPSPSNAFSRRNNRSATAVERPHGYDTSLFNSQSFPADAETVSPPLLQKTATSPRLSYYKNDEIPRRSKPPSIPPPKPQAQMNDTLTSAANPIPHSQPFTNATSSLPPQSNLIKRIPPIPTKNVAPSIPPKPPLNIIPNNPKTNSLPMFDFPSEPAPLPPTGMAPSPVPVSPPRPSYEQPPPTQVEESGQALNWMDSLSKRPQRKKRPSLSNTTPT